MTFMTGAPTNVLLGLIAGMTIFLGLPVARWRTASDQVKGLLALSSAGILLFLIIEVGNHAIEMVESTAKIGVLEPFLLQGFILIAGLLLGLVGLGWIEESRNAKRTDGASPIELATMIAIGIGLHNFAEGLAIGQSFSGGQAALGWILVIGFALHNATEGFGIAGPLAGQEVSIGRLFLLGLIGGGPTAMGSLLGGSFVNQNIELLFLSVAVGSLIYVTRELLRLRFKSISSIASMTALTVGLLLGIGSEIAVEVASARAASTPSNGVTVAASEQNNDKVITFDSSHADPSSISIARGETLRLINQTNRGLEFESNGLMASEAFVPPHKELDVKIVGPEGQYSLSPEGSSGLATIVEVLGGKVEPSFELTQILAAITTIEGHANAAHDLHIHALSGKSKNAALDLKRAGKHAHHPMHELLEDKSPRAFMVQNLLEKHALLLSLKEDLSKFSNLAGQKDAEPKAFERAYKAVVDKVELSRKVIAGARYQQPEFKSAVALAVLAMAEAEYKEAVEGGSLKVIEEAVPGKDAYLEYQDTRGFLKACQRILNTLPRDDFKSDGRKALEHLLEHDFKSVDPIDPKKPMPFKEVEELFERIEHSVSTKNQ